MVEADSALIAAIVVAFGAGAWATTITIQLRGIKRRLTTLERQWSDFIQRFEQVAPYIARGQRASDRSRP